MKCFRLLLAEISSYLISSLFPCFLFLCFRLLLAEISSYRKKFEIDAEQLAFSSPSGGDQFISLVVK